MHSNDQDAKYKRTDLKRGIDHIGVCCVFILHDGKKNFVLAKRSKNTRDEQGMWDPGAGALEHGESFEEAVEREIAEEYCTTPLSMEFINVRNILRELNGAKTHWVAVDFAVLVDPKSVKIGEPDKMDDIGWFTMENLPTPLVSTWPIFIPKVIAAGIV